VNLSEGFIRRPIATSLLMAAIALFGAVAYKSLPVSDLPNIDFPTLLVTAQLPGANPDTMGSSVATPLENQFSMIAGLESMTSVNSLGSTQITLEFDLNRSVALAASRDAYAADVHQSESGRSANPLSGHHVIRAATVDAG
jgi:hydrophobic/amphiphilic exporter-1 (mainly G- bacteria), HAE1 family